MKKALFDWQKPFIGMASFLFSCLALQSCQESKDTQESVSPITGTELPKEAKLGETVFFVIQHYAYNGCGQYSRTQTATDGNSSTITIFVKDDQGKGVACPQALKRLETSYTFTPQRRGDHIFKFRQQGNFLIDTLRVN